MAPGQTDYGNISFRTIPDLDTLLGKIKTYVSKPRGERSYDLNIDFAEALKIDPKQVQESLEKYPDCKDLISYKTRDNGTVEFITLKSRFHCLLDAVKDNGKLSLVKEDIIEDGASLKDVLEDAAKEGLQELVVPAEALKVLSTEGKSIFLSAVEYMLGKIPEERSVKVTCENSDVIKKLLERYGNDGTRKCFFTLSEDDKSKETCCRTISRKTFLEDRRELLLKAIEENKEDRKSFNISTLNADAKTLRVLCQQLNTQDAKGHLIASGFGRNVAKNTIQTILQTGIQRSWYLIFKDAKYDSMENLVKDMKDGWALDCTPSSEKELSVAFYPSDSKEKLSEKISEIFEDKFKEEEKSHTILPQYWKLDTVSALKAADNPNSKVTELVFNVDDDKEALKTLASGIRAFCQEVPVKRNNWRIKVNFGEEKEDECNAFEGALQENGIKNDQQRIILSTKEKRKGLNIDFFYSLIVKTLSPEDYFVRSINFDSHGKERKPDDVYRRALDEWGVLSIGNTLKYLNSPKNNGKVFYDEKHKPEFEALKKAVESVLKSPVGRTGWMISFKNPVIDEAKALLALNKETGVQRYIILCGNRTLLFVNKAMYDLWQGELRQPNKLKVTKELTAQTDGFLPILFAASLRSSSVKELNVAEGVVIPPDVFGFHPFKNVIKDGGGRTGWKIVFEKELSTYFSSDCRHGMTGEVCDAAPSWTNKKCTLEFLPLGKGAKRIFDESLFKKEYVCKGSDSYSIDEYWSEPYTHVPLGMVLECVEKGPEIKDANGNDKVFKIRIKCSQPSKETIIEDLKAFLPKAQESNRPWEIQVTNINEDEATSFAKEVKSLNIKWLPYRINAEVKNGFVSVTLEKKELSERVKSDGTLKLFEQDVAGKTLSQVLDDVGTASKVTTVQHLELPFNPDLYEGAGKGKDAWKSTWWGKVKDPTFMLRETVASLLRRDDFKGLEDLTLTSMEGLKPDVFQYDVNKMLKTRNIDRRVDVSPEGAITFEQHTSMPKFESETRPITTSYYSMGNAPNNQPMRTLKWTKEWEKWFEDPTTDFGEFIEALAEHPEILLR